MYFILVPSTSPGRHQVKVACSVGQCLGHVYIISHLLPQLLQPLPQRAGSCTLPIVQIPSKGHEFRKQKSDVGVISSYNPLLGSAAVEHACLWKQQFALRQHHGATEQGWDQAKGFFGSLKGVLCCAVLRCVIFCCWLIKCYSEKEPKRVFHEEEAGTPGLSGNCLCHFGYVLKELEPLGRTMRTMGRISNVWITSPYFLSKYQSFCLPAHVWKLSCLAHCYLHLTLER